MPGSPEMGLSMIFSFVENGFWITKTGKSHTIQYVKQDFKQANAINGLCSR